MDLEASVARLDALLSEHPDVTVRIAWRVVRGSARRGRRITSRTLPRVAGIAQHAIAIREAIARFIPALPPTLLAVASSARDHVLAIIDATATGARDEDNPEEPDAIG